TPWDRPGSALMATMRSTTPATAPTVTVQITVERRSRRPKLSALSALMMAARNRSPPTINSTATTAITVQTAVVRPPQLSFTRAGRCINAPLVFCNGIARQTATAGSDLHSFYSATNKNLRGDPLTSGASKTRAPTAIMKNCAHVKKATDTFDHSFG